MSEIIFLVTKLTVDHYDAGVQEEENYSSETQGYFRTRESATKRIALPVEDFVKKEDMRFWLEHQVATDPNILKSFISYDSRGEVDGYNHKIVSFLIEEKRLKN